MFSDKFGLTEAVLDGRKTQTRRIITCPKEFKGEWVAGFYVYKRESDGAIINWPCMYDADEATFDGGEILPKYKVGEVVAVAQAYRDFGAYCINFRAMTDKRYAKAEYMPHQIRITGVRVERLQDISDEDCIAEGIREVEVDNNWGKYATHTEYRIVYQDKYGREKLLIGMTPREAYAALIDRISGKGTFERNPYVFVYEFELIK